MRRHLPAKHARHQRLKGRARAPHGRVATAQQMRALLNAVPAMVGYWDAGLRNRMANAAYLDFYGLAPNQIYGKHVRELVGREVYEASARFMQAALAGERQSFERSMADQTGQVQHMQVSYVPDMADGAARGFYVLVTDITAQKELQATLERQATHDGLTGLLNHRGLYEALESECSRFDRFAQASTLLVLDLDHFKLLNDEFGHAAGDRALVEIARLLGRRLRDSDRVARQGGDEFAAILVGTPVATAGPVGEELCEMIADAQLGRPDAQISASIGLAGMTPEDTAASVFVRADGSMYEAKRRGGNSVVAVAA